MIAMTENLRPGQSRSDAASPTTGALPVTDQGH